MEKWSASSKQLLKLRDEQSEIFIHLAQLINGLASPVRIKIIHFLSQGPLSVETLANKLDQEIANTSMHLRKMHSEKLVMVEKLGQKRLYSLHPGLFLFWEQCQDFIQKLFPKVELPVEEIFEEMNWNYSLDETVKMLKNGELIFLDVRPEDEMEKVLDGFEKKIIQIPASEILIKMNSLPKKKKILVICRGRFCALSAGIVNELRKNKFNAFRFKDSFFVLKQKILFSTE